MSLTFKGNNLQPADRSLFFEIVEGLHEPPNVRGIDTTVPSLAYRIHRNRVNDALPIVLVGWVSGIGTTDAAKASSFTATRKLLRTWFDPTTGAGNLVVGLNDGTTGTISAVARDVAPGPLISAAFRRFSIELEAFAAWVFV